MEITLKLYSENNCIAELESYVKELFERHELSPELYPNMLISLTEAVNNAIKHGNLNDENKEVFIRTRLTETRIMCIISDEGEGFDYKNLPDPTSPENVDKLGGRGVFLMKQLSDEITFRNNGSTVELEFIKLS